MKLKNIESSVLVVAVLGSLVLLNIVGVALFGRADMTRDNQFTLNLASIDTLKGLKDPITVRAYFSKDLPAPLASVARYVKDLLDEYYAKGHGNFRYEFIDPTSEETEADREKKKELKQDIFGRVMREKTSVEKELETLGIRPFAVRVNEADKIEEKMAYMGVAVTYGDKKEVMPVVTKTEDFEYDLTTLIRKVSREKAPKVALIGGHDGPDLQKEMQATYSMLQQLYEVTVLDLNSKAEIPPDVAAILVIGPRTAFTDAEKMAIDAFITSGKSAAFLLGPMSPDMQTLNPNETNPNLADLLATYGVKIEPGVVLDTLCASIAVTQQQGYMRISQPVRYPFILTPKDISAGHPLTRGLSAITYPFASALTLEAVSAENFAADIVIKSSSEAWIMSAPYNLDPMHRWTRDEVGELAARNLMVTLSGQIASHYKKAEGAEAGVGANARVLVAGSHMFVLDQFMSKPNQALILNMMDWLIMDEALLAVRSRGLDAAPLADLGDASKSLVKYANIVGLPLVFVAFGLLRWRMREARRKKVTV